MVIVIYIYINKNIITVLYNHTTNIIHSGVPAIVTVTHYDLISVTLAATFLHSEDGILYCSIVGQHLQCFPSKFLLSSAFFYHILATNRSPTLCGRCIQSVRLVGFLAGVCNIRDYPILQDGKI